MTSFIKMIDTTTEWLGRTIAWLTLLMMILMTAVVVVRYLFNENSIFLQESVMYLHGMVFMFASGYTLKHNGHVRVDIFYRKMSVQKRAAVDLFGTLFLLFPVMIFIGWASWDHIALAWKTKEASTEPGGIPAIYLLKSLTLVLVVVMLFQGLAEALKQIFTLMGSQAFLEETHEEHL